MILRVVVYWLILLVCDVLSGEFIENYDNSSYWKLENMTVTKYPKVDNEHQTISIFKNIPNTESKISFNITILVNTSTSSGKQDNIIIAVVSTSNQTLNEFIKNAFFNMVLNNNMPQKKLLKLYRPWYAAFGKTSPPVIKPGKPWPARPQEYYYLSLTANKKQQTTGKTKTPTKKNSNSNMIFTTPNQYQKVATEHLTKSSPASNRPFFAGLGTTRPPRIKPGKPWPAKLEDYANFSGTTDRNLNIVDRFQEVTTENPKMQTSIPNSIVLPPASDRPFFAGLGTTRPPRIKPGKPWPAKPDDYANFSGTTDKNPNVVDRFQEVTTENLKMQTTIANSIVLTPASNRPFFAGLGTTRAPLIKPGKPWPAKPEDYANFNTTTDRNFNIVDRLQEVSTQKQNTLTTIPNTTVSTPASDRPFFAGLGTTRPPLIKPGKPWPAKPEDYANFNKTTDRNFNIVDRLQEVSTQKQNTQTIIPNTTVSTPASDRPFFAGLGTTRPPLIKPGKPWLAKSEEI